MIEIDFDKIRDDFGSVSEFSKSEEISVSVINGISKKTSNHFKSGSKSFKAFKTLKRLGYIKEKEIV